MLEILWNPEFEKILENVSKSLPPSKVRRVEFCEEEDCTYVIGYNELGEEVFRELTDYITAIQAES